MDFVFNDGGRKAAGFRGRARDCVTRAIAIAAKIPYADVYHDINEVAATERTGAGKRSSAREGVFRRTYQAYLENLGWAWVPTMQIGSGCRVHLHDGELPMGRIIARLSKHLTVVIDGVVHDTFNPQRTTIICEAGLQRFARRCVYGYFHKPE